MRYVFPILLILTASACAETPEEAIRAAQEALRQGKVADALKLAEKAATLAPKNAVPQFLRGVALEGLGKTEDAITAYGKAVELDGKLAAAYNARGGAHFKRGQIKESLADFDKFLELRPDKKEDHWQRGITLYYAGQFEEGRDQFKLGDKVFANDVENAFWHYLCNARANGVEKARKEILKIGRDARVPLMEVYALIKGEAKPEAVLAAIKEGTPAAGELNERLFYGHLYLGLYFEAIGDGKKAEEHLTKAADDHKIGHYMWDVARVHKEILKKKDRK